MSGIALALSATAIALQVLDERGDLQAPYGQRSFAVLLFQDIAVVPILALVPLLAAGTADGREPTRFVTAAIVVGRRRRGGARRALPLNPLFRVLREPGRAR